MFWTKKSGEGDEIVITEITVWQYMHSAFKNIPLTFNDWNYQN